MSKLKIFIAFVSLQKRELRRAYYAAISFMDHLVGRAINAIDEAGLADNTIIMFVGDHGLHVRSISFLKFDGYMSLIIGWRTLQLGQIYKL